MIATCFRTSKTTHPMKKLVLSFLLAVLPLALFGASGTAIPGGNQATAFIINKPGAYYLAANRVMTTKAYAAIQIEASDVTLDLNGFTLSFSDVDGGTGNGIKTGGSNVEIRNGSITVTPAYAIKAYGSGLRIIDVRMDDTKGIYSEAEAALVERCHIVDSRTSAVHATGWGSVVKDCIIRNVIQSYGVGGVGINASSYGEVVGNSINYTAGAAIECSGKGAVVKNNRVLLANQAHLNWSGGILALGAQMYISGNVIDRTAGQGSGSITIRASSREMSSRAPRKSACSSAPASSRTKRAPSSAATWAPGIPVA
jgi:hypothetical protein